MPDSDPDLCWRALTAGEDYLILLLSPHAMKSACASCRFALAETEKALASLSIRANVIELDVTL